MPSSLGRYAEDDQVFWCDEANVRLQPTEYYHQTRAQPELPCTRLRRRSPYRTIMSSGSPEQEGAEHSRRVGFVPRVEVRRGDATAVGKVTVRADVVALAVALGGVSRRMRRTLDVRTKSPSASGESGPSVVQTLFLMPISDRLMTAEETPYSAISTSNDPPAGLCAAQTRGRSSTQGQLTAREIHRPTEAARGTRRTRASTIGRTSGS
jgi:hypothetical protein